MANGEEKDNKWYMNPAAAVHATHDSSSFISADSNDHTELIETASVEQIETRGSGIIDLK